MPVDSESWPPSPPLSPTCPASGVFSQPPECIPRPEGSRPLGSAVPAPRCPPPASPAAHLIGVCSLGLLCCVFQVLKKRWVKVTEVTLFFPKFLPFRQFLYSVLIVSLNTVLHLQWVHVSTPSCSCDCKLKVAIFGVIRCKAESEGLGRMGVVGSQLLS